MNVPRTFAVAALATASATLAACSPSPVVTVTAPASATPSAGPSATSSPSPTAPATPPPTHPLGFGDEMSLPASADGASWSGCSPGSGPLPTGIYVGYTSQWNTTEVRFDLVCLWWGDDANAQMIAHGVEPDPYVEDPWYITNDNTTIRVVPVANGGAIEAKKCDGDQIYTLAQVIADPGGTVILSAPYLIRIYVTDGEITALACNFLP